MKTAKQQSFYLDGQTYRYRITASAIKKYEEATGRQVNNSLPLTQVVRFLYYVMLMPPSSITPTKFGSDKTKKAWKPE